MVLTEEEIISGLKKGTSFLLTGPAGVGKTYLIKKIYEKLKEEGVSVALTSTTGINALNLGGITVHKLFGLVNRSDMAYINTMKASFLFKGIKMRLQKLKVIIVDEISMLRSDTFELINRILQLCLENNKPLGGMSFIFTGDFFQIPPVVKQSENHTNQWIFQSEAWKKANIVPIVLEKIYRQKDEKFISFLQNIRIGQWNSEMHNILFFCQNNQSINNDVTHFFSTNQECDEWNQTRIDEIKGKSYFFDAEVHGKRNSKYKYDKISIVKDTNAKQMLELKVGEKVISIINQPGKTEIEYANGSCGVVKNINDSKNNTYVEVEFDDHPGKIFQIKKYTFVKNDMKGNKVASFKQFPLIPAYALTIHKSQGMTLEKAVVDCKNIFASGQMYVALSRVKTMEGLKIINFNKNNIYVNPEVKSFYDSIKR